MEAPYASQTSLNMYQITRRHLQKISNSNMKLDLNEIWSQYIDVLRTGRWQGKWFLTSSVFSAHPVSYQMGRGKAISVRRSGGP